MATIDTIKQAIVHNEHYPAANSVQAPLGDEQAKSPNASPAEIATAFVNSLQAAISAEDINGIVKHFRDDGFWRDILCIDSGDWNAFRTPELAGALKKFGVPKIQKLTVIKPLDAAIVPVNETVTWLQAFTTFETEKTRGKGFVRLRESAPGAGDWKAYTFFTATWEVKGHEEFSGQRRPLGAEHGEHSSALNWLDKRKEKVKFDETDPKVLIVGGGQNGLMLAARLAVLGIDALIVEKNPRLGDSWRNRYHTLCLHDPVWADHFPYVSYPPSWPIYTPKDKIANWFEHYAEIMELNVWLNSTIERDPVFDEATKQWTVSVVRDGQAPRKMTVNHLVLATGFSGEPRLPSFPRDEFKGTVCHSSGHKGAMGWEGKKAVVVGCCNSGHDIAADFYEHGADVTMIQRSSTYVMSSKHGIPGLLNGYYEENGPPLDDADIMLTSLPVDMLEEYHIEATKAIAVKDKEMLDGLEKVGFKLNPYPGGLFIKYFRDGGGYYIDVGASKLIADGKIKIKQGQEVDRLSADGIVMADGVEIKADIIVLATGYTSQRETVRRIISEDVANRIGPCWGKDAQGEIPGVWRNSGVPRFTIQSGNMFQARCYSKHTAMLIQLQELGLVEEPAYPEYKKLDDPRY